MNDNEDAGDGAVAPADPPAPEDVERAVEALLFAAAGPDRNRASHDGSCRAISAATWRRCSSRSLK